MLSDFKLTVALLSPDSSYTYASTCSINSSGQYQLEITSQTPSDTLLSTETPANVTVALPRSAAHLPRDPFPPQPPHTAWTSSFEEDPQTVRKLVLRKRTTSPYQIKLPLMRDRLRVRSGRLIFHPPPVVKSLGFLMPLAPPAIRVDCAMDVYSASSSRSPNISSPAEHGRQIQSPVPLYPPAFKRLDANAGPGNGRTTDPTGIPGIDSMAFRTALPTMDTWAEICEDLCRAMEVLSILSDLDDASFHPSVSTCSHIEDPQPCALALGSTCSTSAGPWNSRVFLRVFA